MFKLIMRIIHWLTKPFSNCGNSNCCSGYHPVDDVKETLTKDK